MPPMPQQPSRQRLQPRQAGMDARNVSQSAWGVCCRVPPPVDQRRTMPAAVEGLVWVVQLCATLAAASTFTGGPSRPLLACHTDPAVPGCVPAGRPAARLAPPRRCGAPGAVGVPLCIRVCKAGAYSACNARRSDLQHSQPTAAMSLPRRRSSAAAAPP